MIDLVERLRGWSGQVTPVSSTDMYAMTQEAADEIDRLRTSVQKVQRTTRSDALEEAAQVAEKAWETQREHWHAEDIAAAIRALKEKP